MACHLLDGNVLVSLVVPDHVHHRASRAWMQDVDAFSTCPTVQGSLVRMLVRLGTSAERAKEVLDVIVRDRRHDQWLDDIVYADVDLSGVYGHRQVTDAYLAQLARSRGGRVATFDRGLASSASDVAVLVPR